MSVIYSDLENKKVLITGASRGIGKSIALSLAAQKAHVVFNYRQSEEAANKLKEELLGAGAAKVTALCFDVTDEAAYKEALDAFIKSEGPLEGLVNNAGISRDQLVLRLKSNDLDEILNVNTKSVVMLTQHLTRSFLKAKDVSIVNMSSIVGLMGNSSQVAYATSKAALIGFTKSYAKELASRQIRCNAVCPGFIETEMTAALSEEAKKHYAETIPLGSMGKSEDVANLVLFLLSSSSRYMTGEILKIDGGLYM